jgi:hypothetical protein
MKDMVLDSNKVALLKEYAKVTERTEDLICMTMTDNPVQFEELTGINIPTVARLGSDGIVCTEIKYRRCILLLPVKYIAECNVIIDGLLHESLTTRFTAEEDFLDLFSKEEKADTSLENFFNDNLENVVRKLRETYPDVVENIEQNVISNICDYDLEDSDKEYFAESYIEDNPVSSVETAESYLSDEDKKRFICDWVDEL